MKKIRYSRLKCIGCGICAVEAPNIFTIGKHDAKVELLDGQPEKNYHERILWPDELQVMQAIVKLCSVKAIQII